MSKVRNTVDVIVIGTGPSGLTAAKVLAEAGIDTLVLEKRAKSGAKNFSGGIVYSKPLEEIFGRFWEGEKIAPVERTLAEHRAYLLQKDSFVFINLHSKNDTQAAFNILREPFNNWMLEETEKSGALVLCGKVVRELIVKDKKIIGVKTDEEELFSNVVIVAEGVNSVLTKTSGLRKGELTPDQVFLFVEENIVLSSKLIEERLNLESSQGLAAKFFTASFLDMQSIGYLSTNKDSISIGIGVLLSELIAKKININQCQEKLKSHTAIKSLLSGGVTNRFISYTLPFHGEEHPIALPKIFSNGCLLAGGAAMLANPFSVDLSYASIISGKLAAHAVIEAKKSNDYSERFLSCYGDMIKEQKLVEAFHKIPVLANDNLNIETLNNLGLITLQKEK